MERMSAGRKLLEAGPWGEWQKQDTDQRRKISPPPLQKPYPEDAKLIDLVEAHTPLDSTHQHVLSVAAEVAFGARP